MKFRFIFAVGIFFAFLATEAAAAHYSHRHASNTPPMGITTGPKTGTYIAFGRDIARVARQEGLPMNVYDSEGSIQNIERITSKQKVGLAIVQSDVLGFLKRSHNQNSAMMAKKLRMVAPLYNEEVHVLARNNIHSLADLAGKRVVVGAAGSGSMITAVNIFSILSISPAKLYEIDPPRGVVAVLNDEADAMIFVGGKPVKMFKNMEELANIHQGANTGKLDQVHFLPVNDPILLKEYRPATLNGGDYNYVTNDVPTIAVTAVLVTYDYTLKREEYYYRQCHNMARLAHALTDHLEALQANGHPKWKEVDLTADLAIWKRDACSANAFASSRDIGSESINPSDAGLEKDLIGVIRGNASR